MSDGFDLLGGENELKSDGVLVGMKEKKKHCLNGPFLRKGPAEEIRRTALGGSR